eukprot:gene24910-biopygen23938
MALHLFLCLPPPQGRALRGMSTLTAIFARQRLSGRRPGGTLEMEQPPPHGRSTPCAVLSQLFCTARPDQCVVPPQSFRFTALQRDPWFSVVRVCAGTRPVPFLPSERRRGERARAYNGRSWTKSDSVGLRSWVQIRPWSEPDSDWGVRPGQTSTRSDSLYLTQALGRTDALCLTQYLGRTDVLCRSCLPVGWTHSVCLCVSLPPPPLRGPVRSMHEPCIAAPAAASQGRIYRAHASPPVPYGELLEMFEAPLRTRQGSQDTGAGVARARGNFWLVWRGRGAGTRQLLACVARAWRGHGAGLACDPSGRGRGRGAVVLPAAAGKPPCAHTERTEHSACPIKQW